MEDIKTNQYGEKAKGKTVTVKEVTAAVVLFS